MVRGQGGLQITWMQGLLQVADDLNGPWITLAEATSPFELNAAASRRFRAFGLNTGNASVRV